MVYEIMGQIQNAVLDMIGTAGIVSYAAQRTPQFQKYKEKQETIRQHKEALKEGGSTIRGSRALSFETALTGYLSELTEDEGKEVMKSGEYYDLLTTQREDFVENWYKIGMEAEKQAENAIASKTAIKESVNATRDKIKGGV